MNLAITLSIVSHRQRALVAALLRDIAAFDSDRIAAIVLTRNVPEPDIDIPSTLRDRVTVIDNPTPRGFGANHNAAASRCETALFAILNPDLRLRADPFDALARAFEDSRGADLGIVAPTIVSIAGEPEDAARSIITPWRLVRRRLLGRDRVPSARPDWLAGMFLLVRASAFRRVGGFDERYFMYCEDFDLCARLALASWRFAVNPDVTVVHDAQRASRGSFQHLRWHVTSLLRMWTSSAFWRYRDLLRSGTR